MSGCTRGPDLSPLEDALGVAAPIAYVATLASAAGQGDVGTCVTSSAADSATIEVSARCPLPLAPEARGTIVVTGLASAVYVASFLDVDSDGRKLVVEKVSAFTASRRDEEITVAYALADVEIVRRKSVTLSQSGWVVKVDTNGTPANTGDDSITVTGAAQRVENANTMQATLSAVTLSGACARNPVAGSAAIQRVGAGDISITTVRFHAACDGEADIPASIGTSSLFSSGSSVPLDFLD